MSDLPPPEGSPESDAGGEPDLGSIFGMAMEMQQQLADAQAQAAEALLEGSAGGGAVRIEVTGGLEFRSVTIDPSVIDPADPELLGDLVLAALHDALAQVNGLQQQAMGPLAGALGSLGGGAGAGGGGLDDLLGGLDLGALGAGDDDEDDDEPDAGSDGGGDAR